MSPLTCTDKNSSAANYVVLSTNSDILIIQIKFNYWLSKSFY